MLPSVTVAKRISLLLVSMAALQAISGGASTSQAQAQGQSSRPRIDQSIRGMTYYNETAKFTLTVPDGWTVASPSGDLNFFGGLQDKRTSAAIILERVSVPLRNRVQRLWRPISNGLPTTANFPKDQ
jgi:hypothetical protein